MTRTLAPRALVTVSVAAAVGLGLLTVATVDADAAPDTLPASATASPSGADDSTGTPSGPSAPVPTLPASGEQVTVAGTVRASCAAGVPFLAGTPAPGWWLDDSRDPGEVEFENGSHKLEVKVACLGDAPQFFVEGPREDGSGRGRGGDDAARSTAPAGPTGGASHDDSDSRVGGGPGSDDGAGDDSGRGRGRGRGGDD